VLKLSQQIRSTHSQDSAVVLDILHGQMFRFNLVGSRILELLKQGLSEPQIAEEISHEFCADLQTVEGDLQEFLAYLQRHHLLESRERENPSAL
jgi:hypothetical protein